MNQPLQNCWREFETRPGTWARWRIGPIEVNARSSEEEWRFAWRRVGRALDEELWWNEESELADEDSYQMSRYVLADPGLLLSLRPRLADRAIVFRLETALYVQPGQEASLFVSSPVWLVFSVSSPKARELLEIATWRPSDTWFGRNTIEGELSYASLTNARTGVDQLRPLNHRAITPIHVHNQGSDPLLVAHLRLPVTVLSLYVAQDQRLWTDPVVFERAADESAATFRIRGKSRHLPGSMEQIGSPREELPRRRLVDTLGRLLQ